MNAKSVELAQAIVEVINEADLPFAVTAKRRTAPVKDVSELNGLEVTVYYGSRKSEQATRGSYVRTYKPVIGIQRKLTPGAGEANRLSEADALQQFVETLEDAIEAAGNLAGLSFIGFDEEQDREAYNVEAMQSLGVFATAIVLEYFG